MAQHARKVWEVGLLQELVARGRRDPGEGCHLLDMRVLVPGAEGGGGQGLGVGDAGGDPDEVRGGRGGHGGWME